MIYLLSQIVFALLLAALAGGALGWLLHRTTQARETGQLRNAIHRQRQQAAQLSSEVTMLTDDYDEMQRQSHDEISELREANLQIPRLNSNLEKSQLLVSQMLKRHESQLRDLNSQNQTLTQQLKEVEAREQMVKRQQADLDSARRERAISEPLAATTETGAASEPEANAKASTEGELTATAEANTENELAVSAEAVSEADLAVSTDDIAEKHELAATPQESVANELVVSTEEASAGELADPGVESELAVSTRHDSEEELAAPAKAEPSADKASSNEKAVSAEQPTESNETVADRTESDPSSEKASNDADVASQTMITSSRNTSSWASAPLLVEEAITVSESSKSVLTDADTTAESDTAINTLASAESDPGAELGTELSASLDANPNTGPNADQRSHLNANLSAELETDLNAETPSSTVKKRSVRSLPSRELGKPSVIFLDADTPREVSDDNTITPTDHNSNNTDSDHDPFDQMIDVDDQLMQHSDSKLDDNAFLNSLDKAVSNQNDPLDDEQSPFVPVEQHDDLQQIGGIGPATEKALNDLGITSYAQLAKLKHHEIETIANALHIVPDRIERDDWVGNARRQLEDVLEQL